ELAVRGPAPGPGGLRAEELVVGELLRARFEDVDERLEAVGHGAESMLNAPGVRHRYFVETFGCQMNVHDTARMEEIFVSFGWESVPAAADADVIVLNTCSVREKAEQKLRSEVGK